MRAKEPLTRSAAVVEPEAEEYPGCFFRKSSRRQLRWGIVACDLRPGQDNLKRLLCTSQLAIYAPLATATISTTRAVSASRKFLAIEVREFWEERKMQVELLSI
jgi:hypothetical protein